MQKENTQLLDLVRNLHTRFSSDQFKHLRFIFLSSDLMYYLPSKDSGWKELHTWPIGQWRGQKSWKLKLVGREVFPTRFPPDDVEVDVGVVSMMSVVDGVIDVDAVDVYNAVDVDSGVDVVNAIDVDNVLDFEWC